jgi:carbon starvation protein
MGFYLFRFRVGKVGEVSVIGVALLSCAVIFGHFVPGSPLGGAFSLSSRTLIILLASYGFLASVLPVWMLLCPRDYLSTYMKIGTVALLAVGIIVMAPKLQMPAFTQFVHGGGPIIPGKLYPFMFITIACGAISGFHSLIASGTTPKMIMSEKDIPFIGYGSMLVEGMVGIMALIAATVLIPGDYFSINTKLSAQALTALGFAPDRIKDLSAMVGINVEGRPGGAVSLAVGMASILCNIPGMKGLMPYWYNFALMFEALFILTTVDAGTRVARFLLQEIGGTIWAPLGKQRSIPGILFFSGAVSVSWAYLIFSGNVSTIWPMFGVANQILAGVAFGVATALIIKAGKLKYAWVTFVPMVFMFVTTLTAAWELLVLFRAKARAAATAAEAFNFNLDFTLVLCMAVLAVIALADIAWKGIGHAVKTRA